MSTDTNAILVVRRLPDYVRGMQAGTSREMVGTVRRTNAGVIFTVPGRGNFVWEGSSLTRVDGEGTHSRYVVEESEVDDATVLASQAPQADAPPRSPALPKSAAPRAPVSTGAVGDVVDPNVEAAILGALAGGASLKMREIQDTTKLSDEVLRPALASMKRTGKLATTGQTRGTRYTAV